MGRRRARSVQVAAAARAVAAAMALAVAVPGCHFVEYDPAALIAERAPPGAEDCGEVGWFGDPAPPARACVLAALAAGRPFHVLVDADVADGRVAVGWAADGAGFVRLDYEAVYAMFLGGDEEDVRWSPCAWLESRGATCPTLAGDLCFACVPSPPAAGTGP